MPGDAAATREKILVAAVSEFAGHGLAGARIDRIAELAAANKRSIYVYYGSKEMLFNAAVERVIAELTSAVPPTAEDLPGYAGRLFDYMQQHPETPRMHLWRQLERPSAGPDELALYAEQINIIGNDEQPQAAGGIGPTDLLLLVVSLTWSWFISPQDLRVADGSEPVSRERIAAHRAAIVEAAGRISNQRV